MQPDKNFGDGTGQAFIHGKALTRPVTGSSQAPHLAGDGGAGLFFPLPYAFEEFLTPQVAAADILLIELTLNYDLGGDAGVIGSRLP